MGNHVETPKEVLERYSLCLRGDLQDVDALVRHHQKGWELHRVAKLHSGHLQPRQRRPTTQVNEARNQNK